MMNIHLKILLALPVLAFIISDSLQAQSVKEVGQQLTEQYFEVLNLEVPNSELRDGKDVWMTSLPSNFDLESYKSEISQLSDRLGVEVIGEWVEIAGMNAYVVNHEGNTFYLARMLDSNMFFAMIEEGESAPANIINNTNTSDSWTTIHRFSGSGMKYTQTFTVSSSEWRVEYRSEATDSATGGEGHLLQLYLLEPGQELFEGELIAYEVNKRRQYF